MRPFSSSLALALALVGCADGPDSARGARGESAFKGTKVDVCHLAASGSDYDIVSLLITISDSAVQQHLAHGDVLPGAYYADADGDGYGEGAPAACPTAVGYATAGGDCDGSNGGVHPGSAEICDGIDNDCDGGTDEGAQGAFYADGDGDGFGAGAAIPACDQPAGTAAVSGDCDDGEGAINPSAEEVCDGANNDCDGGTDEGVQGTFYADADADGFGDASSAAQACAAPAGYVADSADCDDASAAINPGEGEVCDGLDNDCDAQADEGVKSTFYADSDGDTYGDPAASAQACAAPAGYTAGSGDCDDASIAVNPGAAEVCGDGADNDCAGGDEACPAEPAECPCYDAELAAGFLAGESFLTTLDTTCEGDGSSLDVTTVGSNDDVEITYSLSAYSVAGAGGTGYYCDRFFEDYSATVQDTKPATLDEYEACKVILEDYIAAEGLECNDLDGDGFGAAGDCDDGDASVYPGAPEVCGDGADNDCSGDTDAACGCPCFDAAELAAAYAGVYGVEDLSSQGCWDDTTTPGLPAAYLSFSSRTSASSLRTQDFRAFTSASGLEAGDPLVYSCSSSAELDGASYLDESSDELSEGEFAACRDLLLGQAAETGLVCDCRDDDEDGNASCAGDCDDLNKDINMYRPETAGDGIDNDCDPFTNDDGTTGSGSSCPCFTAEEIQGYYEGSGASSATCGVDDVTALPSSMVTFGSYSFWIFTNGYGSAATYACDVVIPDPGGSTTTVTNTPVDRPEYDACQAEIEEWAASQPLTCATP